jgi:6-phosphogluconolactonase/glucosamine-6-phosphate isomerase/deaminase
MNSVACSDLWLSAKNAFPVKFKRRGGRRANAGPFGGRVGEVPREALSVGMATILQAASIVLVALGRSKAPAVASAFSGRISTDKPASFLQLHPRVTVIVDRAAAAKLPPAHVEPNLQQHVDGPRRRHS